jgi:hypothetical protein
MVLFPAAFYQDELCPAVRLRYNAQT